LLRDGQEIRVLWCLMAGMPDAAIERALDITHGTLRTYMDRLFQKAGTRNRIGVVMKALEPLLREKG